MADDSFDFETVAALCSYALQHGPLGNDLYDTMSALNGKRTASSYQHKFRAVLKRARELKDLKDKGTKLQPVVPKPKTPRAKSTSKTPSSKKRGKLESPLSFSRTIEADRRPCQVDLKQEDDDEPDNSPSKRPKTESDAGSGAGSSA